MTQASPTGSPGRLCLSGQPACTGIAPCDLCLQATKQLMLVPACTAAFGLATKLHGVIREHAEDPAVSRTPDELAAYDETLDALAQLPKEQAALFLQMWDAGRAELFRRVSLAIQNHQTTSQTSSSAASPTESTPEADSPAIAPAVVAEQAPAVAPAVAPSTRRNGSGKPKPAQSPVTVTVPAEQDQKEAAHGDRDHRDEDQDHDRQRTPGG